MKKIAILTILLALPMVASGTIRLLTSGDLPYVTQANGDTLRISGTNISSSGGGITVQHNNILIDGQNDTLMFASGGGGVVGIYVNSQYITIRNLWLIQDGSADNIDGIKISSAVHDLTLQGVKVKIYAVNNARCVDSYGQGSVAYNLIIDSCRFWNYSTGYNSRMAYEGAALRLELRNPTLGPSDWSAKVYGSAVYVAAHCGMAFLGKNDASLLKDLEISYCTTFVDHQNTMYPVFDGQTGHSSANAYGILVSYADGGLRIHNNYIGAGTLAGGSRGLMLEGIDGTPTDTAKIYDNVIDINCGPDVNYSPARNSYVSAWAVRIRDIDMGTGEYMEFYNNDVKITLDTNSTVGSAYGYWGTAMHLSETKNHDAHFNIHNNRFEVEVLNSRPEIDGVGVRIMATPYDETIKFYNNHVKSPTRLIWFYSGAGIEFINDTLEFASITVNPRTFYLGYWQGNNTGNIMTNAVYLNGAVYNDIGMNPSGSADLSLRRTVSVFVQGNNSQPVAGASVTVNNNYGQTVLTGLTDANGNLSGTVTYWWDQLAGSDSTGFNDFTIKAKKDSDSTIINYTIDGTSYSPAVTLQNTVGQQGSDIIPPEQIDDLGAAAATSSSITLTWTAPGDDGASGTASEYDLRLSASTINDGNWNSATRALGVPGPKPAGGNESFEVTDLSDGATYFFAIRTRDELHNWSAISNVASGTITDQTPPAAIADLNAGPGSVNTEVLLSWTAPGDDGNSGQAAQYDIRYANAYITGSNWDIATQVAGEPNPQNAGGSESFVVGNLTPGTTYYFAAKSADESNNWSSLSNNAAGGDFSDNVAPAAIANLNASSGFNAGELYLSWSAVGDDGNEGIATSYEIRYSYNAITEPNWSNAAIYGNSLTPLAAGQGMSLMMAGLQPGQLYYLAVKARDDNGNSSLISNSASAEAQLDLSLGGDDDSLVLLGPSNGSVVANSQPTFVVSNVNELMQNEYHFQVAANSVFSSLVSEGAVSQEAGNSTSWQTPVVLETGLTYYWRVQVNGSEYSDFAAFEVAPSIHVYPNPFDMNLESAATFTEIPENANLLLMSVSGATIRLWNNITGGEVTWNGTNESGGQVASGTYLWFVENSDLNGKLIVRR